MCAAAPSPPRGAAPRPGDEARGYPAARPITRRGGSVPNSTAAPPPHSRRRGGLRTAISTSRIRVANTSASGARNTHGSPVNSAYADQHRQYGPHTTHQPECAAINSSATARSWVSHATGAYGQGFGPSERCRPATRHHRLTPLERARRTAGRRTPLPQDRHTSSRPSAPRIPERAPRRARARGPLPRSERPLPVVHVRARL